MIKVSDKEIIYVKDSITISCDRNEVNELLELVKDCFLDVLKFVKTAEPICLI